MIDLRPHTPRHKMLRGSLVALAAFGLLVVVPTVLSAQDWAGRGRVQGRVEDENGNPVEGATVKLTKVGTEKGPPEEIKTNKRGMWSYLGLGGGQWRIEITYPGYAISDGTIPVSEFGSNQAPVVKLQPSGGAAAAEAPAVSAAEEAASKALAEASALLGEGKYAEARTIMEGTLEAMDDVNKKVAMMLNIAKTHVQEGDSASAIGVLEEALALDPAHVESLKLVSSLLVNEGRQAEAEAYMAKLPEGQKIDPNALLNQGIQKYNNNDLDGALTDFDAIVSDYPDNADAYYYRGLVNLGKANNDLAIADFSKMLELAPDHANAGEAKQFLDYLKSQ